MVTDRRYALGLDPGPTKTAWSLIEMGPNGMAHYVGSGMLLSTDPDAFRAKLAGAASVGALVAVELPTALHPRAGADPANLFARSKQLLATMKVGASIATEARSAGLEVVELSAGQWRHALTGKNNASNPLIERAVRMFTTGFPTKSNEHVRDALGLAIVAARTGRRQTGRVA